MKISVKELTHLGNLDEVVEYREFFEAFGFGGNFTYKMDISPAKRVITKIDECIHLRKTMFEISDIPEIVENWICNRITENLNELEELAIIDGNDNSLEKWVNMY